MISKIYFENKPVFLTDDLGDVTEFMHQPETIFVDEINTRAVNSLLHEIATPQFGKGVLFYHDFNAMETAFQRHFKIIQAAGGLVRNETGEILFIFRKGKWDLPKGKNDNNESSKECALREVMEETGLKSVKAGKYICTTKHTYKEFGKHILKETQWFNMQAPSPQKLTPQLEEGIEKIDWVGALDINEKLQDSYALIADVLKHSGVRL